MLRDKVFVPCLQNLTLYLFYFLIVFGVFVAETVIMCSDPRYSVLDISWSPTICSVRYLRLFRQLLMLLNLITENSSFYADVFHCIHFRFQFLLKQRSIINGLNIIIMFIQYLCADSCIDVQQRGYYARSTGIWIDGKCFHSFTSLKCSLFRPYSIGMSVDAMI